MTHASHRSTGRAWWHPAAIGVLLIALSFTAMSCSSGGDDASPDTTGTTQDADGGGSGGEPTSETRTARTRSPLPDDVALPIVFVHGFAGSAQQYESQAMRFVANGYPAERIIAYEHDGAGFDIAGLRRRASTEVVDERSRSSAPSRCTSSATRAGRSSRARYLGDPARAAKVAKYIAIDGAPARRRCRACADPGDVPGPVPRRGGTSEESFAVQYEFLVGEAPEVVDIVPQREPVEITGRAVNFPANTGREGDARHLGDRRRDRCAHRRRPARHLRARGRRRRRARRGRDRRALRVRADARRRRSSTTSTSSPTCAAALRASAVSRARRRHRAEHQRRRRPHHADRHPHARVVRRDDGDLPGDQSDVLEVGADGGERPSMRSTDFVGNGAIGIHLHDDAATPGETHARPLPYFSDQPFQSGVDVFMPGRPTAPADHRHATCPAATPTAPRCCNVPNWPSSGHAVSVVFTDWPVDGAS